MAVIDFLWQAFHFVIPHTNELLGTSVLVLSLKTGRGKVGNLREKL
jgi:hypothetical protein